MKLICEYKWDHFCVMPVVYLLVVVQLCSILLHSLPLIQYLAVGAIVSAACLSRQSATAADKAISCWWLAEVLDSTCTPTDVVICLH